MIFGLQLISKDYTVTQPDEEANDDDHEEDDGDHDHDHDNGNDDQPRLDNASTSRRLPALTSSLHPQLLKEKTCQDFSKKKIKNCV